MRRSGRLVAVERYPSLRVEHMNRRKPTYFRNSLDLREKVQVKVLRKRLTLSDEQFASIVRKSGNSISAITKEDTTSRPDQLGAEPILLGLRRIDASWRH